MISAGISLSVAGRVAVGTVSPLGQDARGVDADTALHLANQHRRGIAGEHNAAEAAFWARHALTRSLDTDRMRWALTQAGAGFVQDGERRPDYAKARLVWEIAADLGDPVALCFLADLHEHGLGVTADKATALALVLKAKAAGGCRGIDATIERLQR